MRRATKKINKSITTKNYNGEVRNLEVGNDNSFCSLYHTLHNCAVYGIPVVTGDTVTAGKTVFPELQTKSRDVINQTQLINKLMVDKDFNKYVATKGYYNYKEHYGLDACIERLYKTLLKLGVKNQWKFQQTNKKEAETREHDKSTLDWWYEGFGETPEGKKDDTFKGGGTDMTRRELNA